MTYLKRLLKFILKVVRPIEDAKNVGKNKLGLKPEFQDLSGIKDNSKFLEEVKIGVEERTVAGEHKDASQMISNVIFDAKKIGGGSKAHGNGTQDSLFLDTNIVAVADGVGESIGSEIASEFVTKKFAEEFKKIEKVDFKSVGEIWTKLGDSLKEIYEKEYVNSEKIDFERVLTGFLATTLLFVAELESSYIITYLGNGSIWYVRGDFWEFLESRRKWPWCVENILIPHSTYAGEEALYGILDYKGLRGSPAIMQLQKDSNKGEIFILTTDGISSKDQLKVFGPNFEKDYQTPGKLQINNNIYNILLILKDYLYNYDTTLPLSDKINEFLKSKKFSDDSTLAILIGDKAVEYFKSKKVNVNEKDKGV